MAVRSTDNNSLFFATGLDNSGLKQGTFDALGMIQSFAGKVSNINPFLALSAAAILAFTTISAEAYKLAKEYEHAMKEVSTISDATQQDFEGMSKKVFSISEISPDDPVKLAKAYYQIVSAGHDGAKGLNVLETSAKAATAGVTDTETAADGLTTVMNAWKIDASEATTVADSFFTTVKLGKTNFKQLADSIAIVAPIAASANIPLNEIMATVASITKQGTPTSVAMTQVRSAILGMQEAGRLDGTKTLQQNMQALYETMNGDSTAIREEVGRVEGLNAILAISGNNAESAKKDLLVYNDTVGATEKANKEMLTSNNNQWAIFRNKIKSITYDLGESMLSMSNTFVGGLNIMLTEQKLVTEETINQAAKFDALQDTLFGANTEFKRKIEILKELKNTYPNYLESLDIDKIKNENLDEALEGVKKSLGEINKLHERRILLAGYEDNKSTAEFEKDKYERLLSEYKRKFSKLIVEAREIAEEEGIELNFSLTDPTSEIFYEIQRKFHTKENSGIIDQFFEDKKQITNALFHTQHSIDIYSKSLYKATENLNKENKALKEQEILLRNTKSGYKDVVSEINKVKSINDLSSYKEDYDFPKITEAIKARESVLNDISKVNSITKTVYQKNKDILKEYLNAENEEVKNAAIARIKILKGNAPKAETTSFNDKLKEKEEQYKAYNLAIEKGDMGLADKLKQNYSLKEADYISYLQRLYEYTKDSEHKINILSALDSNGAQLNREKVEHINIDVKPIKLKPVDYSDYVTSINQLEKELAELRDRYRKSTSKKEKAELDKKIKTKEKDLELERDINKKRDDLYSDLTRSIENLSNKELSNYIRNLKEKLKHEKLTAKEIIEINGKIQNAKDNMAGKIQEISNQMTDSLRGIGSLFKKFGDEETGNLLDQFAGVMEGNAQMAMGIITGNPADIIGGAVKVIDSAVTVEVSSDTEKFEKAIKKLEKAIEQLDYAISKSIGEDRVSTRKDAIEDLKELEEQAIKAQEAEKEARKEVKLLGIGVGKKGKGSGTDADKLEELEQKAEDARRKVEELNRELNELYTGTTHQTIVDSILSGLKEGKTEIKDFADTFEDLMKGALLESFKMKYLEKQLSNWFETFGEFSGDSDGLTSTEITHLSSLLNTVLQDAQVGLEEMNNVLNEAGLGNIDSGNKPGLAGAISTITEDTANILAGTLNSIRIDVSNGLAIAEQSSNYLSQIVQNTSYNHFLESMNTRLGNIEDLLG